MLNQILMSSSTLDQVRKAAIGYFYGQETVSLNELKQVVADFGRRKRLAEEEFIPVAKQIQYEVALFKVKSE